MAEVNAGNGIMTGREETEIATEEIEMTDAAVAAAGEADVTKDVVTSGTATGAGIMVTGIAGIQVMISARY